MVKADLHIHTTESDGELTPEELVVYSKEQGLEYIAKTDHNTIEGNDEAVKTGENIGVRVFPGVELSVEDFFEGKKVTNHLHGYNMDAGQVNPALNEFFIKDAIAKNDQSARICDFAQDNPIVLSDGSLIKPTFEDLRRFVSSDKILHWGEFGAYIADKINGLYNRVNGTQREIIIGMYQALAIFMNGDEKYISEFKEKLSPYVKSKIGNIGWKLSPDKNLKATLSMEDALKFILEADGVPVIAHPGEKGRMLKAETLADKYAADEKYLIHLKKLGLVGIEVYSPKHSDEQTEAYYEMANRLGLLMGAGTDFHGITYSPDKELGYRTKRQAVQKILFPFEHVKPLIDVLLR